TGEPLYGGSGVNHALRLMHFGVPVFPILSVGEDRAGREIQNALLKAAAKNSWEDRVRSFVNSSEFFVPGMVTPQSTIIVFRGQRTILKQESDKDRRF